MAQAAKAAAPQGKKAAAAAATDAYEDNLDLALALGWAFLDRVSFEVPLSVHWQPLQHHQMCWLTLLTPCVEWPFCQEAAM